MSSRQKQAVISRFFKPAKQKADVNALPPKNLDSTIGSLDGKSPTASKLGRNFAFQDASQDNIHVLTAEGEEGPSAAPSCEIVPSHLSESQKGAEIVEVFDESSSIDLKHVAAKPKKRQAAPMSSSASKKKRSSNYTPLEIQLLQLKDANPDKMLLIQVGYKYKLFGKDAEAAAKILGIMYIPDNSPDPERAVFSYCSFPDFKLHINIKRLLSHGFKVGVIKQMESAIAKAVEKSGRSDVMKREVTGVYTKGTYMDDELAASGGTKGFDDDDNNDYIVCVSQKDDETALIALQPWTGVIVHDSFKNTLSQNELDTRFLYLNPSELIIISHAEADVVPIKKLVASRNGQASIQIDNAMCDDEVDLRLADAFRGREDLASFYANFSHNIRACIYHLHRYLAEFRLENIFTLTQNVSAFSSSHKHMVMSSNTLHGLDILVNSSDPKSSRGTLFWLLDHTRTKAGKRLLRSWVSKPLIERASIEERTQAVTDLGLSFNHVVDALKSELEKIGKSIDLEGLLIKAHYTSSNMSVKITMREIYIMLSLFNDLMKFAKLFEMLIGELPTKFTSPLLLSVFQKLKTCSEAEFIPKFLSMISDRYNPDSEKSIDDQKITFFDLEAHSWPGISTELAQIQEIEEKLEAEIARIRKLLNRPQLKYTTNNREPYLIEVRNGKQVDELPPDFQRVNGTTTVSRFRSLETAHLYKLLQYHNENLQSNCDAAFLDFLLQIDEEYLQFSDLVQCVATFDCLLSLTAASKLGGTYCCPNLVSDQIIEVRKGRNVIIENLLTLQHYVPNDINMRYDRDRVLIITGPNMGGKSSYVKQVALIVIMSQIGCHLPCDSATLGVFNAIFIRMGADDNILKGDSTFMTEMSECSKIINEMSSKSLIILDEVGRGTGTSDGIAIAYSIVRYLIECAAKPLAMFITHYPSLGTLENRFPQVVANYHMGYQQVESKTDLFPRVVFMYNIMRGVANNLYGLNVAKLANLPEHIIRTAFEVSEQLKAKIQREHTELLSVSTMRFFAQIKNDNDTYNDLAAKELNRISLEWC